MGIPAAGGIHLPATAKSKPTPRGTSLPATCEVGEYFFKTDATAGQNTYACTAPDVWTVQGDGGGAGSGYVTVQDEGSSLTQQTTINFTGDGISCSDNAGQIRTDCTVTGGGGGGDSASVNGIAAEDANFDDATPSAPADGMNVRWQKDASTPNNISANVPFADETQAGAVSTNTQTFAGDKTFSGMVQAERLGVGVAPDPFASILTAETFTPSAANSYLTGIGIYTYFSPSVNVTSGFLLGVDGTAIASNSDKNIDHIIGHTGDVVANPDYSGTIDKASGQYAFLENKGSGVITNAHGSLIRSTLNSGSGSITNNYGLRIENQTAGTNNWAIKTGTGVVEFGDMASAPILNATTGFRVNSAATDGRYLKGDGTNFVTSDGSASGTGSCTNQAVTALNSDAAPTCTTITSAYVDSTVRTGTVGTANGGTGQTAATDDTIAIYNGTGTDLQSIPDCTDTGGKHLNYTASTNALSCGTSGGAGGGLGYTLSFGHLSYTPADTVSYYFGDYNFVPTTTANFNRVYVPKAGTVKVAEVNIKVTGILATTEQATIALRLNNTSDTTITSVAQFDTAFQHYSNTGLSIAVVEGDYFEIKVTTPEWPQNPTATGINVVIYIE
ncbi:MAG: hypothetical protein HY648_10055 [Acidobacteria bacterium]|nr:hypothetical protein [Acidobacteriota bacterium]